MSKKHVHKPRRIKRASTKRAPEDVLLEAPEDQPDEGNPAFMEDARRHALIAEHAYYLAEERQFEPGHELDDWLAAEKEVEQALPEDDGGATLCGG